MQSKTLPWYESKEVWMSIITAFISILMSIYQASNESQKGILEAHSFLRGLLHSLELFG